MNKIILMIVVGFISSCAPGIRYGEYCHKVIGGGGPCVEFEEKNNFNWETSGDLGTISMGSGTYRIKNHQIRLKFKKDSVKYQSGFKILNSERTAGDSVTLKVKIENELSHPVPGVTFSLKDVTNKEYSSNFKGKLQINNLLKGEKEIEIKVSAMGYKDFVFSFIPDKNSELLITINRLKPKIISDTTFVYKIMEKNPKKLRLRNSTGQSLEFKRIKE